MTNHHSFSTWWCKFSCSIRNEMLEIILTKHLLKVNPVTSVKGNSFNWHSLFTVDNKITLLCASTAAHLPLNLGMVSMGSFQLAHVPNPLPKKYLGSEQAARGLTWNFVSGHLTSSSPKGSSLFVSFTFPSGEHPRIGELVRMHNKSTLENMYWCFLTVHVLVIPVNCYWLVFNPMSCVSRVECLWKHDFLSKFIMTALSMGN